MSCPNCHVETEGRKWQVTSSQIMFDREMLETQGCGLLTAVIPSINPPTHPNYRPAAQPYTCRYALDRADPAYLACVNFRRITAVSTQYIKEFTWAAAHGDE